MPQQAEVARGLPGRLRPRIFLTFGTTRVLSRQPYLPYAFTPGEISGTHFQRLTRPQGTWFRRGGGTEKIPIDTTGNRVWQELEYRIDVCPVTSGEHIESL